MNWKGFGNFPGGTEENHEKLSQVRRFPCRDLNPVPPEYEAGVLMTQPRLSVSRNMKHIFSWFSRYHTLISDDQVILVSNVTITELTLRDCVSARQTLLLEIVLPNTGMQVSFSTYLLDS
jgi:hypothetical protein